MHTVLAEIKPAAAVRGGSLLNKARSGEVDLINTVSVYYDAYLRSMIPKSTRSRANCLPERSGLRYTTT